MTVPDLLADPPAEHTTDPLAGLGVRASAEGGELRVWSEHADAMELVLFDSDPDWIVGTIPLERDAHDVWSARSSRLVPGRRYGLRVSGPAAVGNTYNPSTVLLDPYARAISRNSPSSWQSVVADDGFDWGHSAKPGTPLDHTVIYEAHVRGLTKLNPAIPSALRGTYAGLAHESTIGYLKDLGVTAVELLPVHAFSSERRLVGQGLSNYWGYNSLAFFAPHPLYASRENQQKGPQAVLREFKGMVKLLHEAGLEVILDVVYNHTAEEGIGGPRTSFRGIDNRGYYRQTPSGEYIDTTGCGNTLDFGRPVPQRLVRDSIRYWANEMQIDGFRFDLAATLGRDDRAHFDPEHPLLYGLRDDPELAGVKLIAEPWDVGMGGWQTGNFPYGWSEWNDSYRGTVRDFWLTDLASMRGGGGARSGIGSLAGALAGSANVFRATRGPLTSVNFVTAHDGFTMADLTSFNYKHNIGNGEQNRDGTDDNRSFNFGIEGDTRSPRILAERRRTMRNLMGTLLLSAGVPMITAGDEHGRTQRGNNNAYCHDSELTWVSWKHADWQRELHAVTRRLIQLRRENPALRPVRYAKLDAKTPSATEMNWYSASGMEMSTDDWNSTQTRCVQYLAASTPEFEDFNRVLVVVHGAEQELAVVLPAHDDVTRYELLWSSGEHDEGAQHAPGDVFAASGPTLTVFRAS
ncbi:glycogen debranching protein GlgX [Naasia lichenicola]|uniref:Glycogen debranching protein GlgX n=1 Tax=Naasia lichenicola TaxID=2565933 RepID=A0A4S4FN70_9MICO|nr:glycogen debranching protein GlgX [Naasia lichenicola]THG31708.1 glycogen debranching protein GlgX [Naasia lichenicola]